MHLLKVKILSLSCILEACPTDSLVLDYKTGDGSEITYDCQNSWRCNLNIYFLFYFVGLVQKEHIYLGLSKERELLGHLYQLFQGFAAFPSWDLLIILIPSLHFSSFCQDQLWKETHCSWKFFHICTNVVLAIQFSSGPSFSVVLGCCVCCSCFCFLRFHPYSKFLQAEVVSRCYVLWVFVLSFFFWS